MFVPQRFAQVSDPREDERKKAEDLFNSKAGTKSAPEQIAWLEKQLASFGTFTAEQKGTNWYKWRLEWYTEKLASLRSAPGGNGTAFTPTQLSAGDKQQLHEVAANMLGNVNLRGSFRKYFEPSDLAGAISGQGTVSVQIPISDEKVIQASFMPFLSNLAALCGGTFSIKPTFQSSGQKDGMEALSVSFCITPNPTAAIR